MTVLGNGSSYDWDTWLMGIWRAFIGGGAGAIGGFTGPSYVDPEHFNLTSHAGLKATLFCVGVSFASAALGSMMIFLHTHPGPDPLAPKEVK